MTVTHASAQVRAPLLGALLSPTNWEPRHFDVASVYSQSERQMCVEEVAADGTVGATLLAWNKYGTV